jgi:tetratricopeptide (TPR) repeat protein
VEAFSRGVGLRPDDASAWVRLAQAQRLSGATKAAAETLIIALRYRPQAADLWLDLGLLEVRLKHLEAAAAILDRLRAMDTPLADRLDTALHAIRSGRSPAGAAAGKPGR